MTNDLSYSPIVLKKGDKGDKVEKIQKVLQDLGYFTDEVNGNFDIKTFNALIKFQLKNKLPTNGIVDQNIQSALFYQLKSIKEQSIKKYEDVKIGLFVKDKEFLISDWYKNNWQFIIRPKEKTLCENIAKNYELCYQNYNICYNKDTQNSLFEIAKINLMDLSKISQFCESDNRNLVATCCIAAGLSQDIFYRQSNLNNIETFISDCKEIPNLMILDSLNYTAQKEFLKRGDIIVSKDLIGIILSDGNKVGQIAPIKTVAHTFKIKVSVNKLNVRVKPNMSSPAVAIIKKDSVYTIVEERYGWGKLKSGRGWIDLQYTEKL